MAATRAGVQGHKNQLETTPVNFSAFRIHSEIIETRIAQDVRYITNVSNPSLADETIFESGTCLKNHFDAMLECPGLSSDLPKNRSGALETIRA